MTLFFQAWTRTASLSLLLAITSACATEEGRPAADNVSIAERSLATEVAHAERLGRLIFDQDTAAWVATDALLAEQDYADSIGPEVRGWLSYSTGDFYETIFVGVRDSEPTALFRVRTRGTEIIDTERLPNGAPLRPAEALRWQVRTTVAQQDLERCSDFPSLNTIILPIPDDPEGKFYGYAFSATRIPNLVVLGKHYRFTVSPDGSEVLETRDFSKSCIALPNKPHDGINALFVTHVTKPYPEEHHVFASLSHNALLYVGTGEDVVWRVEDGSIERAVGR